MTDHTTPHDDQGRMDHGPPVDRGRDDGRGIDRADVYHDAPADDRGEVGRLRREVALSRFELYHHELLTAGRRLFLKSILASPDGRATIDAARAMTLPRGVNPKVYGSLHVELVRRGIIERDGYTASVRPESHGRAVIVWRLRDRAAAERWLAAHEISPPSHAAPPLMQEEPDAVDVGPVGKTELCPPHPTHVATPPQGELLLF